MEKNWELEYKLPEAIATLKEVEEMLGPEILRQLGSSKTESDGNVYYPVFDEDRESRWDTINVQMHLIQEEGIPYMLVHCKKRLTDSRLQALANAMIKFEEIGTIEHMSVFSFRYEYSHCTNLFKHCKVAYIAIYKALYNEIPVLDDNE